MFRSTQAWALPAAFVVSLVVFSLMSTQTLPQDQASVNDAATQHASQLQSPQRPQPAVVKATTRLVLIDVAATDRHGQSVEGLKLEDFTVLEDGREQTIRAFKWQVTPVSAVETKTQTAKLPPDVFSNVSQARQADPLNVILLDAINNAPEDQAYADDEALKFLSDVKPNQLIAVFVLTTSRLEMLQDFTNDGGLLRLALNKFRVELPVLEGGGTHGKFEADTTSSRFQELCRVLASYPGRKNLIWLSRGFLIRTTDKLGLWVHSRAAGEITAALIDSQSVLYPVDPRGVHGLEQLGNHLSWSYLDAKELAELTGGKAFYGRNDIDKGIASSMDDGMNYYTLGYYPDNKNWDGRFRRIQVNINRPAMELRYRRGYYADAPNAYESRDPKEWQNDLARALSLNAPAATMLLFRARVIQPSAETQNKVVIHFAIDPHSITFERKDDGREYVNVDCGAKVYEPEGKPVKGSMTKLEAGLKSDEFTRVFQQGLPCQHELVLPSATYLLKLAVRDGRSGFMGTANARVRVP